jgi:hypothetical protein
MKIRKQLHNSRLFAVNSEKNTWEESTKNGDNGSKIF